MAVLVVLLALGAGLCPGYFSIQVTMQGLLRCAGSPGNWLDTVLLKKANRPVAHSTGQHRVNLIVVDEGRYLSGPVAVVKGIFYGLDGYDCIFFNLGDDKVGAATKVVADGTL